MSLRKKCIYVAMAAVFTAQTAAAQGYLKEAFITQAAIDKEVDRQIPIVQGAIAKATMSVRPVAGPGIAVKALADGSGAEVSLRNQLKVGDMRGGALAVWVCPETGRTLLMPARRDEATRVQWSTCNFQVSGLRQGFSSGEANTGLALAAAAGHGCEAQAAEFAAAYAVYDDGRRVPEGASETLLDSVTTPPIHSRFSMLTPADVSIFARGGLEQINAALQEAGGFPVRPGTYWLGYQRPAAAAELSGPPVAAALTIGTDGSLGVVYLPVSEAHEVLLGWFTK